MEIGLNFLWLLLAVAAFLVWGREAARPSTRPHALKLAALGCALALLFPVISVTDDLHAQQAVMEDSNPSKRTLQAASHAPIHVPKLGHPLIAEAGLVVSLPVLMVLGNITSAFLATPSFFAADSHRGRAPPSLLS